MRRVAVRLAGLTVGLVLVLLIVLEGVVFVITRQALLDTLTATLRNRAHQADYTTCREFHLTCPRPPGPGGPGGPPPGLGGGNGGNGHHGTGANGTNGQSGTGASQGNDYGGPSPGGGNLNAFGPRTGPSEASAVYVNRQLTIKHADGSVGWHLLAPSDAQLAMTTASVRCCSTKTYDGQDYLVYSAPLKSGARVVGAVQTSISEHQYEHALSSLEVALLRVALLGLLGSAVVTIVLVGRALRPIRLAMRRQQDFVADAAHELRTPLAIQRTVGEVGMADASTDELRSTVEQMLDENLHLTRLVEDLSLLARSDTDSIAIDRRPVDLSKLLSDTAEEIGYLAAEKGISLQEDVRGDVTMLGDVLRLRQLVLILLDNALKHTPSGGTVHVRLSIDSTRALLEVADSGEGIGPADLPRLFDRFYQADRARAGEGTGLGLAIAKWIVEAHGGQIRAGNASPSGAVFSVALPLSRAEQRAAPSKSSYRVPGS